MFLKRLNLTNFRNYASLELNFDQRSTILVGNNAVGKSNLLEAIYLLSTTKSLRAEKEEELIKKGEQFTRIEGFLEDNGETKLLVIINIPAEQVAFKKKALVNGISRRAVDFIGNLPAVIFYPSDINMVTGSPSLRRWHLDLCLAQVDEQYKKALTLYEQFLISRNRVLKKIREGEGRKDELDYWTRGLIDHGQIISSKRKVFFNFINNLEKPLGDFSFGYNPSEVTAEKLTQTNGREVAAAATLIGPHRDDFDITLENHSLSLRDHEVAKQSSTDWEDLSRAQLRDSHGVEVTTPRNDRNRRNLAKFGSRGEQRTATLAFKLTQLEYMAKVLGKRPILLLDDVFSELDANHRAHVVEIVSKQQTVIATVELENIPQSFLDSARILKVEDGKITS